MHNCITIGCQGGGPETKVIGEAKVGLFKALSEHVTDTHCEAVDEYSLVLRVGGSLDSFGPEGITCLRFAKKKRYITVDIQIPKEVWAPLNGPSLARYLSDKVLAAVSICVQRLKKDGYIVVECMLMDQIQRGICAYLGKTIKHTNGNKNH